MPVLVGPTVTLRPVTADDRPRLLEILATPEVSRWWDSPAHDTDWPMDEEADTRFAILLEGKVVGLIQFGEETDPMYRHAGIDLFLDPAAQGRGLGQDSIRTLARYLFGERGHHRLVIDPAADNHRAISSYAAVGFRPVGVMRAYERNADGTGWHDGLLMDLLVTDLGEAAPTPPAAG